MTRYAMAIDTKRCAGCNCCAMACKVENNVPEGNWWNRAKTAGGSYEATPAGTYPDNLSMYFYTLACQHCSNPACVEVCPTGASSIDETTGAVLIDYEVCIGCKSCMEACPYEGVRCFNENEPAYYLDFATGDVEAPTHLQGVVEKCTFCNHRLLRGERPACVDICSYGARFFGDLDDPESTVSKLLAVRDSEQLLIEQGTEPNVYFLK